MGKIPDDLVAELGGVFKYIDDSIVMCLPEGVAPHSYFADN